MYLNLPPQKSRETINQLLLNTCASRGNRAASVCVNRLLPAAAGDFTLSPTGAVPSGERTLVACGGTLPQAEGVGVVASATCCSFLFLSRQKANSEHAFNSGLLCKRLQRLERFRASPTDWKMAPGAVPSLDTVAPGSHLLAPRIPLAVNGISTPVVLFLPHLSLFAALRFLWPVLSPDKAAVGRRCEMHALPFQHPSRISPRPCWDRGHQDICF